MSSYTITITPDDTTRASTTLRVDVSDTATRITELLVRAGSAAGLAAHQLPAVDLDLLLRAISPGAAPAALRSGTTSVTPAESAPADDLGAPVSSRRPARRQRAGAKQTATKATAGSSTRTGEKPAKAAKASRAAAKKAGSAGGERAYRRAPDDLVQVFEQVGGVTAVARHYGVPRHTAQSWVRRLRNEGQLPAGR